jgi:bacteriocin-like protein
VVKRLNEKNLKSVNGGEYNYTKVWQVLRGRWADIQVEIAYEEIMKEERSQIQKLKELRNQN